MSFSQQSGSDRAAADAEARRKQVADRYEGPRSRPVTDTSSQPGGIIAKFRAWVRRALAR